MQQIKLKIVLDSKTANPMRFLENSAQRLTQYS